LRSYNAKNIATGVTSKITLSAGNVIFGVSGQGDITTLFITLLPGKNIQDPNAIFGVVSC